MPNTVGPEDLPNLLVATTDLAQRVNVLSDHLTVSQDQALRAEKQAHRTKYLTRLVFALVVLSLLGVGINAIVIQEVRDTGAANKANAVTACRNANDSRQANKALWDWLVNASLAQSTQTPEARELLRELSEYIKALYTPHDCADLSKKYPLPDPPPVIDVSPQKP